MTSKNVHELNDLNFDALVTRAPGPVLVDFTARWCPPCRALSPLVERVAERFESVTVGSVDVDDWPELASRFGVRGMPTLVVFEFGHETARHIGLTNEKGIVALLGIDSPDVGEPHVSGDCGL